MFSPKSPKSQKLMQFRDKLSKLSNKQEVSLEIQKLEQLDLQNKKLELQISLTFDQISDYYLKSEQRVNNHFEVIIQNLKRQESQILGKLAYYKQKQLQEVKFCSNQFISYQKLIRDKIRQLESTSPSYQIIQQVKDLKSFDLNKFHRKIQEMTFNRSALQKSIEQFQSLKDVFGLDQKKDLFDFHRNMIHQKASQNQVKQLKVSNISKNLNEKLELKNDDYSQNRKKTNKKLSRQFTENQSEGEKSQNNCNKLNDLLFERKSQQKQENLMQQDSCFRNSKLQVRRQLKYLKAYEEEDLEQKTEKMPNCAVKEENNRKSERKNSDRTVVESKVQNNLNLLTNLHQGNYIRDGSSRQIHKLEYKTKLNKLSRVKSQQNLIYSKARINPSEIEENVEKPQTYVKINDNLSIVNSMRGSKNTLRESKTGKRGDWASILKDQQAKYNQMRKKLKN